MRKLVAEEGQEGGRIQQRFGPQEDADRAPLLGAEPFVVADEEFGRFLALARRWRRPTALDARFDKRLLAERLYDRLVHPAIIEPFPVKIPKGQAEGARIP